MTTKPCVRCHLPHEPNRGRYYHDPDALGCRRRWCPRYEPPAPWWLLTLNRLLGARKAT